jgi:hypothetical protein
MKFSKRLQGISAFWTSIGVLLFLVSLVAFATLLPRNHVAAVIAPPLSLLQSQNLDLSSAGHASITVNISTSAGNLLVAWCSEGTNNTDTPRVSDSASNAWTQVGSYVSRSDNVNRAGLFYAKNAAAVTSVTCTFSTAGGINHPRLMIWEIAGADTASPLDTSVGVNNGASGLISTSGALTTTNANDILILATDVSTNQTSPFYTAGSGYTIPTNAAAVRLGMEYKITTSTQSNVTASMTHTVSSLYDSIFAAFK